MKGLLSNVRVIDLTRMLAGPYGTMLLADMGAEMIKIEDDIGDHTRGGTQASLGGMGAYFLSVNRNKKSVVLDLKTSEGLNILYDLIKVADVVVDNMRPKALKKLKCDYEDLIKIKPDIISCSLSGFGHTGPYKDRTAFDLTIQAISGGMSVTGEEGGAPMRMGLPIGDVGGGLMAALAIVSALNYRHATGKGQKLDVSLLDTQISLASYMTAYWLVGGKLCGPQGSRHGTIVPYEAFKTRDIWLVIACPTEKFWEGLCIAMELDNLILDDRFNDPNKRLEHHDDLIPILAEKFLTRPGDQWLSLLREADVPCAPVNTLDRILSDPQVLARQMVVDMHHPELGDFKLAGNPIKASETEQPLNAPPQLGADTVDVLSSILGYSDGRIDNLIKDNVIGICKEETDDK